MLRKKEIQKYFVEHFKMKINEFFVLPKELEVLGPGFSLFSLSQTIKLSYQSFFNSLFQKRAFLL